MPDGADLLLTTNAVEVVLMSMKMNAQALILSKRHGFRL